MAEKVRKDLGFNPLYASLSRQDDDEIVVFNKDTQQLFHRSLASIGEENTGSLSTKFEVSSLTASGDISASGVISASRLFASESIFTSGHLFASLSLSESFDFVVVYDATGSQLLLTSSEAIGGAATLQETMEGGSTTSIMISSSAEIMLSGSGNIQGGAITASSAFISGNLIVKGTGSFGVFITTYESSSIIYSSGSTKFGDTFDDLHQRTGSLSVSGSIFVNGVSENFVGYSSSLQVNGTASADVISSSGALFGKLIDNTDLAAKLVIYDNTTGQLFTTTSNAGGVPSLEAVSGITPFKIGENTVLTASNGEESGILVHEIYHGSGSGRLLFTSSYGGNTSVLGIANITVQDDGAFTQGLMISGGNNLTGSTIQYRGGGDGTEKGIIFRDLQHKIAQLSRANTFDLTLFSPNNTSGIGDFRGDKVKGEAFLGGHYIIKDTTNGAGSYETAYRTRITQAGGSGSHQYLQLSSSAVVFTPTSSLPDAVAGGMLYSGSQFYIAVP